MNDPLAVRRLERVGNVDPDFQQRIERNRLAVDAMLQRHALQQFHGDEGHARVLVNVVNRADARMIQCGGCLRLSLKSFKRRLIGRSVLRKEFQRNLASELRVLRAVDHTHPAAAELFYDTVMRDSAADERLGILHGSRILGCISRQVNEDRSGAATADSFKPLCRSIVAGHFGRWHTD